MSTPEQKASNREKQRRFYYSHPEYRIRLNKLRKVDNPLNCVNYHCTFELADPRDNKVRIVSWGLITNPVWKHLWSFKDHSLSKWAAWLRELNLQGLVPVELSGWAIGKITPIDVTLAQRLVYFRIKQTEGLLNSKGPVGCKLVGGKIRHYPSWKETGLKLNTIRLLTHNGQSDFKGRIWFDD